MNADELYAKLLALFERRAARDSLRIAAKLTLALASEVGDMALLNRAIQVAEETPPPAPDYATMRHYGYAYSSSDYRLRITLNLKRICIPYEQLSLRDNAQKSENYRRIHSGGLVPALLMEGDTLTQSLAIIEYLNVLAPQPDILPGNALQQARIRAFAQTIACDIQPLCNLRVIRALTQQHADENDLVQWRRQWIGDGLMHLEERARCWRVNNGKYLFGAQPTLAEICLIPQLYNARRFDVDLSPYPLLCETEGVCLAHRAFRESAPENYVTES